MEGEKTFLRFKPSESKVSSGLEDRPPILLEWKNVKYSVEVGPRNALVKREILKGISGFARPGEVVAIMGSSGAGKTTLLNYLADRVEKSNKAEATGGVTINSAPLSKKLVQRHFGYVMQEDFFFETLTPRELLYFYASTKLPASVTDELKRLRVEELLDQMKITKCADTQVGGMDVSSRGLSGGEKKRLAIASELITDPGVLFLDEPTTGLDSSTALSVLTTLKELAEKSNKTIVCTIHQPSSEIFALFDRLILLMNGHVIYQGPSMKAVNHFDKLGFTCPEFSNPADFFMMKVMQYDDSKEQDKFRLQKLIDGYKESQEEESKDNVPEGGFDGTLITLKDNDFIRERSCGSEFKLLYWRAAVNFFRVPLQSRVRLMQNIAMGLIIGLLYLQIENYQKNISDRQGALFVIMTMNLMTSVTAVILTFSTEKVIFMREHASGLYSTSNYFWSKFCIEYPIQIFFPIIFSSISYWTIGLQNDAAKFAMYLLVNVLLVSIGQSLGFLLAATAASSEIALTLFPLVVMPLILFSGLFLDPVNIPIFLRWLEQISPFKYALNSLMLIEYKGLTLQCKPEELFPPQTGVCFITTGEQVLDLNSISENELGRNIGIMIAVFLTTLLSAYAALLLKTRK